MKALLQIMLYGNRKMAGLLLIIGSVLGILGIIIAETLHPNYSTSENYISDLGVGPTANIFNSSMFLLGLLGVFASYYIQKAFNFRLFSMLAAMTSIGVMGVGLFPEDVGTLHVIFSLITFLLAGISAIMSCKAQKPPLSYLSIVLGVFSLMALLLLAPGVYLGLGAGGMERLVAYPALLWMASFGGHLVGDSKDSSAP